MTAITDVITAVAAEHHFKRVLPRGPDRGCLYFSRLNPDASARVVVKHAELHQEQGDLHEWLRGVFDK